MHHYDFHVGDYMKATAHLSNEEDLCYRRLLDMYYDTEQPIPLGTDWVSRRLRVGSPCLTTVLQDFFVKTESGWVNPRADAEIAAYHAMADRARSNGKLGGRRKKTQSVPAGYPDPAQPLANQEPVTSNQEPVTIGKPSVDGERFAAFWSAYPKKVGKGAAEKAWAKARINGEYDTVLAAIAAQRESVQWRRDGGQYIPNPATWINERRWEDEGVKVVAKERGFVF